MYWQLRILLDCKKGAGDTYKGADLDPGSGAFLTPGSGMRDTGRFFPVPGYGICFLPDPGKTTIFSPSSFVVVVVVRSGNRDRGSGIRDG